MNYNDLKKKYGISDQAPAAGTAPSEPEIRIPDQEPVTAETIPAETDLGAFSGGHREPERKPSRETGEAPVEAPVFQPVEEPVFRRVDTPEFRSPRTPETRSPAVRPRTEVAGGDSGFFRGAGRGGQTRNGNGWAGKWRHFQTNLGTLPWVDIIMIVLTAIGVIRVIADFDAVSLAVAIAVGELLQSLSGLILLIVVIAGLYLMIRRAIFRR